MRGQGVGAYISSSRNATSLRRWRGGGRRRRGCELLGIRGASSAIIQRDISTRTLGPRSGATLCEAGTRPIAKLPFSLSGPERNYVCREASFCLTEPLRHTFSTLTQLSALICTRLSRYPRIHIPPRAALTLPRKLFCGQTSSSGRAARFHVRLPLAITLAVFRSGDCNVYIVPACHDNFPRVQAPAQRSRLDKLDRFGLGRF